MRCAGPRRTSRAATVNGAGLLNPANACSTPGVIHASGVTESAGREARHPVAHPTAGPT